MNGFGLTCDGEGTCLPLPAQRLLAFLALQERPVLRVRAAGVLWIDSTEDRAFGSLRSALWSARRTAEGLVEGTRGHLRLAPHVAVDVRDLMGVVQRVFDSSAPSEAIDLRRISRSGDLLPDWYDDWVLMERERLRLFRIHALETLCERLTTKAIFERAVEAGLAAVTAEPLRESAHRALIQVHLAQGNRAEAIRQYELFQRLLHDELNLEPSDLIKHLVAQAGQ